MDRISLKYHGYLFTAIAFIAGVALILSIPLTIESHQVFSSQIQNHGQDLHTSQLIQLNSSGGTIVIFEAPALSQSGLIKSTQLNAINISNIASESIQPSVTSSGGNGSGPSYYYENLQVGSYYFAFFGNYSANLQFYWTYEPAYLNYPLYGGWALVILSPILGTATYITRKRDKRN